MNTTTRTRNRGFSLVEALMALAVMAFGMVAVVGVQGTLRTTGDLARQRSEASRIAQEQIEQWRAYNSLDAGAHSFASISSDAAPFDVTDASRHQNTIYRVMRTVVALPAPQSGVALRVTVNWEDRTGQTQELALDGLIAGVPPELTGSLSVPAFGSPSRRIDDRSPAIPREAVNQGDGTSTFVPPGSTGVTWTFNNVSGVITITCGGGCPLDGIKAHLLAGYISFATDVIAPTPADAETPPGPLGLTAAELSAMGVEVTTTTRWGIFTPLGSIPCYVATASSYLRYYCAVPYDGVSGPTQGEWSGISNLTGITHLATSLADPSATNLRVCRYTSIRAHSTTPPAPRLPNAEHPLNYTEVAGPLLNQNFLVIRAGDGVSAFDCPADDTSTPYVNGNTWRHQPSS